MIPDKVYIPKNLAPHLTEEWASHTHGSLDEYIRKEVLLEWLEGKMTVEEATEGYIGGYDAALKEVIDKINSM